MCCLPLLSKKGEWIMIKVKTMAEWPDEDYSYPLPDVSMKSLRYALLWLLNGIISVTLMKNIMKKE